MNQRDPRVQKMAEVMVNYSLAIKSGDLCLFRGTSPASMPLLGALMDEALKVGGVPYAYIHITDEAPIMLTSGDISQIEKPNPMLMLMYEKADVIVRVEASENTNELAPFSSEKQKAWSRSWGGPFTFQFEREANRTLRRCTTLFPTPALARDANMALADYEDFVYGACMVNIADPVGYWLALSAEQQQLCNYLNGKQQMHVRGKNIDLHMSIAGRTWENADGKFNFPDGEIFTGPVEDSVNGWVKFTYPAIYQGNVVKGAELHFENGLVTKASATENESFLLAMLDTDAGSRRLGEFAIGTNKFVNKFTGHILFDEKIHGTVHMALGQSYKQTGAVNQSKVHWDMICDMMDGGEIIVDGVKFYENGQFLVS